MRDLKLDDPSMLAAARGRMASLRWRVAMGLAFAAGAALVLDSFALAFCWYLALCLSMCADSAPPWRAG